ncbi:YtxH domain-containing protein [bacterium]|nr:YtxH domain-containing protein [bacterium]
MCKENDSLCFGIGIIAGVVGGVVAGILLAPKKGEESCNDIKCAIENLVETQAPRVQHAKKQALEAIDLVKYKVEKQIKKIKNAVQSEKMEKAKQLEDANSEYDINQ